MLEDYADKAIQFALQNGAQYCDARTEIVTTNGFHIENGEIERFIHASDSGMGIRVLVNGSWSFCAISDPNSVSQIRDKIIEAVKTASYYSEQKKQKVKLADIRACEDNIHFKVAVEPNIEDLTRIGLDCDKLLRTRRISKSSVSIHHDRFHKYFASSEGSRITHIFDDVIANLSATAHYAGLTESVNTTEGGRGGMEMIIGRNDLLVAANLVSEKADALLDANTIKEDNATVVMNPDFVALLTHEILGHPSEADRVLGKEMAWAGGSWWAGKLGTKIGSAELNVIDDPTIQSSLGWYKYDDEGVPASKKLLIENGVLSNHMHSRETAALFNTVPNSAMRASGYSFMPLVRMACTCITPGDWDPEEMIKDVKDGYFISNMKIPSIDMMRYNWSISCQYAHRIENGELKDLLRDVIVMGTSPRFFESIDARGKNFQVRPITNCGKGDPMQIMRMGNGGPHIRARATVKSMVN